MSHWAVETVFAQTLVDDEHNLQHGEIVLEVRWITAKDRHLRNGNVYSWCWWGWVRWFAIGDLRTICSRSDWCNPVFPWLFKSAKGCSSHPVVLWDAWFQTPMFSVIGLSFACCLPSSYFEWGRTVTDCAQRLSAVMRSLAVVLFVPLEPPGVARSDEHRGSDLDLFLICFGDRLPPWYQPHPTDSTHLVVGLFWFVLVDASDLIRFAVVSCPRSRC
jgi:hypothetical protein